MRWSTGEATVERLLAAGHIERVQGAQANGGSWLDRARRSLNAARVLAESAPDSSVVLAYDAARHARRRVLARLHRQDPGTRGHVQAGLMLFAQIPSCGAIPDRVIVVIQGDG